MLKEIEIHNNCTVQVLVDSETGELDIGWWDNDNPPDVIMDINFKENE